MAAPRIPPQVRALVGAETCERLAFHGLTSVLVLYMSEHLLWSERDARAWYHAFLIGAYLAPIAGGWLAERVLGPRRTLLAVIAAWIAGAALAALWPTRDGLLLGLLLVAAGAGGLKPVASAALGDELAGADPSARDRVYRWLYWTVHLGAAAARVVVPALLVAFGPTTALLVPLVLVVGALLLVRRLPAASGAPPRPPPAHPFIRVVARAVSRLGTGHAGQHWLDLARDVHPADAVEGAKAVFRLAPIFAAVTVFWALLDQRGSTWVFQARHMDLALLGRFLSPAQLQAMHPLLVLAAVPLVARAIPALERRGVSVGPARRVAAGLVAAGLAFVAAAVVQMTLDAGWATHALWQIPQYALLAVGEVMVAVTGLELGYTQAPRAMRPTIMSIWFVTIGVGNLLVVLVTGLFRLEGAAWFWAFGVLMLGAAAGFRVLSRSWEPVGGSEGLAAE
jgi:POT family proton-dependent oligopeptide transporter